MGTTHGQAIQTDRVVVKMIDFAALSGTPGLRAARCMATARSRVNFEKLASDAVATVFDA